MVANVFGSRKWLLFAGLAAILAGCGGSTGGVIGPGPGTTRSRPTISLASQAKMQTVFLSGTGRAVASQVAAFNVIRYSNSSSDYIPAGDKALNEEVRVKLDAYNMNMASYGVDFAAGQSSQQYTLFPMEVGRMYQVENDGSLTPLTGQNQIAYRPPVPFDAEVTVMPGRTSTVTIRLSDSMLQFNSSSGQAEMNTDAFIAANYDPILHAMTSSFSDFVAFDLSSMSASDRPFTIATNVAADRVYYSGDGIAMSEGLGDTSEFELLDPIIVKNGKVSTGPLIGPAGQQIPGSNLFVLNDLDPSNTPITSMVGTWRNFGDVIGPTDTVSAVAFPSSREPSDPNLQVEQQFVVFSNSGNKITAMWQGQVFYNSNGNGTFRLFPIKTITDAVPTFTIQGTVTNFTKHNGHVTGGDWNVTGAPPGNWPFPTQGGFSVFRR